MMSNNFKPSERVVGLRSYLVLNTIGTFALQMLGLGIGFATNMLLARFMGATEYGVYTYSFAWVGLLTVLTTFGMNNVLIREIAAYHERADWGLIKGILQWSWSRVLVFSAGITIVVGLGVLLRRKNLDPAIFPAIWIALAIVPLQALFNMSGSIITGLRHTVLANVVNILIRAPLFIISILLFYHLVSQTLTAFSIGILAMGVLLITVVAEFWLLYKILPNQVSVSVAKYQSRFWLTSALPLLLVASLLEINTRTPIFILGSIAKIEGVATFNVASLIANLVGFSLLSVNAVLGPVISGLYESGDLYQLQKIVTVSARIMFLIAGMVSLALYVLRFWLLQLFGSEFQNAAPVISILIFSQMVNVTAGSAGLLLIMTGHEKVTAIGLGISSVVLIVLSLLFISNWGVIGAAWATMCSMIVWNIIFPVFLQRLTGLDSTPLGVRSRWRR